MRLPFSPHLHQHQLFLFFFILDSLLTVRLCSTVVFICISLMMNFTAFLKIDLSYICRFVLGYSIPFQTSESLSLIWYHDILITTTLLYSLKVGTEIPFIFLFPKVALTFQRGFHDYHYCCCFIRDSGMFELSIWKISWRFYRNCLESKKCFGDYYHFFSGIIPPSSWAGYGFHFLMLLLFLEVVSCAFLSIGFSPILLRWLQGIWFLRPTVTELFF